MSNAERLHAPWTIGQSDSALLARYHPACWDDGMKGVDVLDDVGDVVCVVTTDASAGTARLIAASPQLLAACECEEAMYSGLDALMAALQKHGVTEIPSGQSLRGLVRELRRTAIAAATQEPNDGK
jgi:hypothetical protein